MELTMIALILVHMAIAFSPFFTIMIRFDNPERWDTSVDPRDTVLTIWVLTLLAQGLAILATRVILFRIFDVTLPEMYLETFIWVVPFVLTALSLLSMTISSRVKIARIRSHQSEIRSNARNRRQEAEALARREAHERAIEREMKATSRRSFGAAPLGLANTLGRRMILKAVGTGVASLTGLVLGMVFGFESDTVLWTAVGFGVSAAITLSISQV